jgi:hypothetical protein
MLRTETSGGGAKLGIVLDAVFNNLRFGLNLWSRLLVPKNSFNV